MALDERDELDRLDAAAADGDFGTTLARGAAALAADPPEGEPVERLRRASEQVTDAMGGSSGPLCGVALLRAAEALEDDAGAGPGALVLAAIAGIQDFGGAERGDKTALDALFPLAEALNEDAGTPAQAAREAADATAESQARKGRAAYAGERSSGSPDPGAVAVALVAEALEAGEVPGWGDLSGRRPGDGEEEGEDSTARTGFVADPAAFVHEALEGFVRANPGVRRLPGSQVIVRAEPAPEGRVAVVSGGGAGHEPLHAGFVGEGMLDAAVPGAVFTSPAPKEVLAAVTEVAARRRASCHRQELHGRHPELPAGGRVRRGRGHRDRHRRGGRRRGHRRRLRAPTGAARA